MNGGSAKNKVALLCLVCVLGSCTAPRQSHLYQEDKLADISEDKTLLWRDSEGIRAASWQEKEQVNLALLKDDPNHPDAQAQLADIYFKQYILARNSAFLQRAVYYSQKSLALKPNDFALTAAYYRLMYAQIRLEGDPAALNRLKKYYSALPTEMRSSFFPPSLALYLFKLEQFQKAPVQSEVDKKQPADLKKILQQALSEQPRNALIHVQLSRYFFEANQIDVGFGLLHQALHLEPENTQVVLALAEAYRTRAQRTDCIYDHLEDIKRSTQFYKQLLSQQNIDPQVHWGLMVNYAHLGLLPLSLREGEFALGPQSTAVNRWVWANYLAYQGQPKRAEELFLAVRPQLNRVPTRAQVEHYLLAGQWQKAGEAFTDYIATHEQPGVTDLLLASMIQAESQDKSITVNSLWRTTKKAGYYSEFYEALAKYWRGEIDEQRLASHVKSSCQQAELDFYVGYLNLLNNRVANARASFEKSKSVQQPMHFEVQMASRFLQGLLETRGKSK